jgi:hypothetical protein
MSRGGRLAVVGVVAALAALAVGVLWSPGPQPTPYTVVRGDTLFLIAKAHGVSVGELRAWNGITGDLIEVDQVLLIYPAGGEAAAEAPVRRAPRPKGRPVAVDAAPGLADDLAMPAEQPCLEGPSLDGTGDGPEMAASEGLTAAAVDAAMDGFVAKTTRCVTGEVPRGSLVVSMTVACSGRVAGVGVASDPGWDPAVVDCVREVLGYVPFPPHDLPDGEQFDYPLRFQ